MFISPMLLEQADKSFSDGRYVFEPKIDGPPPDLITKKRGDVTLFKTQQRCNSKILGIDNGWLDGELAVMNPDIEIPDVELTIQRSQSKRSQQPISYVVFDILHDDEA